MADPIAYAYNNVAKRIIEGSIDWPNLKLMLLNDDAAFDASHTTIEGPAGVSNVNEVHGNGWAEGGEDVAMSFSVTTTNDGKADTPDVVVTAVGGPIAAYGAVLYDDTDVADAPIFFFDFQGLQTANEGADFKVIINTNGVFQMLYTLPS